jgi:hypothetical protein
MSFVTEKRSVLLTTAVQRDCLTTRQAGHPDLIRLSKCVLAHSQAIAGAVIGGTSLSGAKGRVIGAVLDRPLLHGSLLSSPSRWLFARQFPHPLVLGISDAGANDAYQENRADCMLAQLSVWQHSRYPV